MPAWAQAENGSEAGDEMADYDEIVTPDERRKREAMLDKTLADSFPASDPPSSDPNPYPQDTGEAA